MIKKSVIYAGYILVAVALTFLGFPAVHAGCEKGDCSNGPGRYAWPDGSSYTGDFLNGKFHGQGTYAWADGKKYSGAFKNDTRSGLGTYTWPNGASYVGEWENGKKAGYGIYTFPDGSKNAGIWENGALSQEMGEAETEKFLAAKPAQASPTAAAVVTAPPAATGQGADTELDRQLAALGGQPEATASTAGESLQATEAAPAAMETAAKTPFIISVKKLPLFEDRVFNTWENIPLLAVGPIAPIGTCSVKIDAEASDKDAGRLMVKLKIANSSNCPLDFSGFVQAGEYYVKVISWSGDQAIAPGSEKEVSRAVTLEKDAPRSEILFKLQGEGCRM
jgi:hypothetical protein